MNALYSGLPLRIALCLAATALACGSSVDTSQNSTATGAGASAAGAGGGGAAAGPAGGSAGSAPAVVICNTIPCGPGEQCCLIDGNCFDPLSSPGECVAPTEPGPQGQTPCGSTSDCAPGEFCAPSNPQLCLGPGYCESTSNCGTSSGTLWCGCDGVTYPDVQTACAAGVQVLGNVACGETTTIGGGGGFPGKEVTFCATNAQCPGGQSCCGITGECFDPALPILCTFPPAGTNFPCITDAQCFAGAEYCYAEGCDGPGGCVNIPGTGECDGVLDPVCGCNGTSYVNPECAAAAGTRVAHAGECP